MKIEHDIHTHTHLSLCAKESATIEYYVRSARERGLKVVGIADHMWDAKVPMPDSLRRSAMAGPEGNCVVDYYETQTVSRCQTILKEIGETDTQGVKFLFGGEVEYVPGYGIAISEESAELLDFIVVPNSHTHMIMNQSMYEPYEKHAEFMLRSVMEICTCPMSRYVTSLAHPFDAVCCPYPVDSVLDKITDAQLREVFGAAKEKGIGVEINGGAYWRKTPEEIVNMGRYHVLSVAKECGCMFTFGSDCHSEGGQITLEGTHKVAKLLGLTSEDIHPVIRKAQAM